MVLLIQKEAAERIVAKDHKESLLSLSVKAYGTPKYIDKVSKRYFSPSPKVDSAIISVTDISRARFASSAKESLFFKLIHTGFAHKRKVLIKNLTDKGYDREKIVEQFKELQINEKARSEDVSIEKWLTLSINL